MKILIISGSLPYPFDSGGNISQFAILEKLQNEAEVTLCFAVNNVKEFEYSNKLAYILPQINIKIIDLRIDKISNSYFKHCKILFKKFILLLIKRFQKRVVQLRKSSLDEFDLNYMIQPIFIKSNRFCNQLNKIITKESFDIYQIEFFENLDLVNLLPSHSKKIFVHHEIRYQRLLRSAILSLKDSSYTNYLCNIIKDVEITLLNKYDAVITFSETDNEILKKEVKSRVVSIPFPILSKYFLSEKRIKQIDKVIFIGPENHYPNFDGVVWYIDNCFEDVWNQFQLPFYVVGNWSEETKKKYGIENKIIFSGYVEDLNDFSSFAISISPIHIGSGIRTKILYSMASKVPIVSTSIGAEGLDVINGVHILIADRPRVFVKSIGLIARNLEMANKIADASFELVKTHYSQDNIVKNRMDFYKELIN
jgi:glycosyltransferase involved in cell wall biosynthesis